MEITDILSFKDLMNLLDVSKNKLTRLIKEGLPAVSLGGGRTVFLRESVVEWLESQEERHRGST